MSAFAPDVDTGFADGEKLGFCAWYRKLPKTSETSVRFFQRQDMYTVHGNEAIFVAKEYYKSMGPVKYYGPPGNTLPSLAVSQMMFESVLRDLLLVKHYRVELRQLAKGGMQHRNNWEVTRKASPGNLLQFEDILYREVDTSGRSGMLSVHVSATGGQKSIGVAFCEVGLCEIQVCQFVDNDQYSTFEGLMVQLGAKECVMAAAAPGSDLEKVQRIAVRSGMLVTERKASQFNHKNIVQDLGRLLKLPGGVEAGTLPQIDLKQAMSATTALIGYLELLSNEDNFEQFKLTTYSFDKYMKLDAAAVTALNILPAASDAGNKTACVLGILNTCMSAQGRRLINQWVKQPLTDLHKINERLNLVEALQDHELREAVQTFLKGMADLHTIARKFQRSKADLKDVLSVYNVILRLPEVFSALTTSDCEHPELVHQALASPVEEAMKDLENFQKLAEAVIDIEKSEQDGHRVFINPSYDESGELQKARDGMDTLMEELPDLLDQAASKLKMNAAKDIKLEKDNKGEYFFAVTRKKDKAVRSAGGFQVVQSTKNQVKFNNQKLRTLNASLQEFTHKYEDISEAIIEQVIGIASGYDAVMESLGGHIAEMDVLASFARVSMDAPTPYVRPGMKALGEGDLKLVGIRHPCVEVQDDVNFIANDATMARGASDFCIITGPNMGGKSTYIRSVGVVVLMAQIGCFVPCDSAEIPVVDRILARVGAGDSQLKGVSTFMAEMLETSSIIKAATKNSLIIIDELGRGTSTYDGFGLAWAISEHICKELGSFCLFATHFHELTALAEQHKGVSNLHVTAHTTKDALTLLYRVKEGICDQSFGINVAELANFPPAVIEHAKRKASELEDFEAASTDEGAKEDAARKRAKEDEAIKAFVDAVPADLVNATPEKALATLKGIRTQLLGKLQAAGF